MTDEHLSILDYVMMRDIKTGRIRMTATGADVRELAVFKHRRLVDAGFASALRGRVSTKRLRALGLVHPAKPGDNYRLTEAGEVTLAPWLAERADREPDTTTRKT